ncbi:MAG: hypothetical protein Kow0022_00020 [Phycisphaerales bacterium]
MIAGFLNNILGPRVSPDMVFKHSLRFGTPGFLLLIARVLLLTSLFLPYWHMTLHAPQYPDNLHLTAYLNHLAGDVAEIDGLNHYIGMRSLEEAAQVERSVGVFVMIGFVVLLEFPVSYIHAGLCCWSFQRFSFPRCFCSISTSGCVTSG